MRTQATTHTQPGAGYVATSNAQVPPPNTHITNSELDKQDFENAAFDAKAAAQDLKSGTENVMKDVNAYFRGPVKEGAKEQGDKAAEATAVGVDDAKAKAQRTTTNVRQQAADAFGYLQEQLQPGTTAEKANIQPKDPEVRDFNAVVAEAAGKTQNTVAPKKESQAAVDTAHAYADKATSQAPEEKSYLQQVGETLSSTLAAINPLGGKKAEAKEPEAPLPPAPRLVNNAQEGKAELAEPPPQAVHTEAAAATTNVAGQEQSLYQRACDAALQAKEMTVEAARNISNTFVARMDGSDDDSAKGRLFGGARDAENRAADFNKDAPSADKVSEDASFAAHELGDAARAAKDTVVDSARYVGGKAIDPPADDASRNHETVNKAEANVDAAKDSGKEAADSAADTAKQAGNTVLGALKAIGSRFTAPVSGDAETDNAAINKVTGKAQAAGDAAEDQARGAKATADRTADQAKADAEDRQQALDEAKEGLVYAKDQAVGAVSYVAGRFTAPVSGDASSADKGSPEPTKDAAQNARDAAKGHAEEAKDQAGSVWDNLKKTATSAYDSVKIPVVHEKEEAKAALERGQEQITPSNPVEAKLGQGEIPLNTADILAHRNEK